MFARHAGIDGLIFVLSALFLSLLLDGHLDKILLKLFKGNTKIAGIILAALIFVISFVLTKLLSEPICNLLEQITGLEGWA